MAGKSKVISLSIDEALLARFDEWSAAKAFRSRSQAFQSLVREKLDALAIGEGSGPAVATVTYVYDHHRRELMERMAHLQHAHLSLVVATTHVHLDHARCLEVLILRGPADRVRALAERIIATRGVERGEMTITSAVGEVDAHGHGHGDGHRHGRGHGDGEAHGHGPAWHAAAHAEETASRARPRSKGRAAKGKRRAR